MEGGEVWSKVQGNFPCTATERSCPPPIAGLSVSEIPLDVDRPHLRKWPGASGFAPFNIAFLHPSHPFNTLSPSSSVPHFPFHLRVSPGESSAFSVLSKHIATMHIRKKKFCARVALFVAERSVKEATHKT